MKKFFHINTPVSQRIGHRRTQGVPASAPARPTIFLGPMRTILIKLKKKKMFLFILTINYTYVDNIFKANFEKLE